MTIRCLVRILGLLLLLGSTGAADARGQSFLDLADLEQLDNEFAAMVLRLPRSDFRPRYDRTRERFMEDAYLLTGAPVVPIRSVPEDQRYANEEPAALMVGSVIYVGLTTPRPIEKYVVRAERERDGSISFRCELATTEFVVCRGRLDVDTGILELFETDLLWERLGRPPGTPLVPGCLPEVYDSEVRETECGRIDLLCRLLARIYALQQCRA